MAVPGFVTPGDVPRQMEATGLDLESEQRQESKLYKFCLVGSRQGRHIIGLSVVWVICIVMPIIPPP